MQPKENFDSFWLTAIFNSIVLSQACTIRTPKFYSWVSTMLVKLHSYTSWRKEGLPSVIQLFIQVSNSLSPTKYPRCTVLTSSQFTKSDQEELIIGKIRFKTFDLGGHETGEITFKLNSQTVESSIINVPHFSASTFSQEVMAWLFCFWHRRCRFYRGRGW